MTGQHHPLSGLSDREGVIAGMFAQGMTYRGISEALFIAPTTVRTHLSTIYRKLGVGTKVGLVNLLNEASTASAPDQAQPETRLLVLPFANESDDARQDYFAIGLAEDLIAALAKISGLSVFGRHAMLGFHGKRGGLAQVARLLGATTLLQGSVRSKGNQLRITAELIDVADGACFWA